MAKKILFLANHFITLYSFRKELITKLVEDGHQVYLSIPKDDDNRFFENLGCKIIETPMDRRGVNPIKDLKLINFYRKMIPEIDPDIVFSYTIKPNIYGAFICNGRYKQVCNVTGTGATFLNDNFVAKIAKMLYRMSLPKVYKVFFQNTGDKDFFLKNKMVADNWELIPGSGCNLEGHPYVPMPSDEIVKFLFIGRVMKLKGIDEYLEAAKEIKTKFPNTEFLIAGWNEEEEYKRIVAQYQEQGIVNYIGFRKDINDWIAKCHCVVLPSHGGEGVPNVLLEAAATGRACIGSRIPGTTEVIDNSKTGYLFEPGNVEQLIDCLERFISLSYEDKSAVGCAGHELVRECFDRNIVIEKYINELS